MHSITRKLLWIITFMTLLLNLQADNLTESSQSTVNISMSNSTLSIDSVDFDYIYRVYYIILVILGVIIIILHILECRGNNRNRPFLPFFRAPWQFIYRMYENLRYRETYRANENVFAYMQQIAESRV